MVAYSFKSRFVSPIRLNIKTGTIRADGKRRHARPGEQLQLYCGMRTAACFKIIPDVTCVRVNEICFDLRRPKRIELWSNGVLLRPGSPQADAFARADGFVDFADMLAFWNENHGPKRFDGSHIIWRETQ